MGNDFTTTEAGDLGDDLVGLLDTTYSTITELRRYLSAQGVTDFADHDSSGAADSQVVADCINYGTSKINDYAGMRYDVSTLNTSSASETVKHWCIVLAAYRLCHTRGNPVPDSILNEFDRIMDPRDGELIMLSQGRYQIHGLSLRYDSAPTMSNLLVDRRHHHINIRMTKKISSRPTTVLTQDVHHHHRGHGHE